MGQEATRHQQTGTFGRFTIRDTLGSGGMAEVFLASMSGPGGYEKLVALKCLHPSLASGDYFTDQFISEARISGSLNHHNIVQTVDFGLHADRYFLAMEYVEGITLSQLIRYGIVRRTPLPYGGTIEIMRQICEGLDYAHSAADSQGNPLKMIHRDLKPGNILINVHGLVKIADFGVAKATSNLVTTVKGTLKGTLAYMSPEQARGDDIDHRADLFSLGAILFALLTQAPLYPHVDDESQGLIRVMKGDFDSRLELLSKCPGPLVAIVVKLLARDRTQRYSSAGDVRRDLLAALPRVSVEPFELSQQVLEVRSRTTNAPPVDSEISLSSSWSLAQALVEEGDDTRIAEPPASEGDMAFSQQLAPVTTAPTASLRRETLTPKHLLEIETVETELFPTTRKRPNMIRLEPVAPRPESKDSPPELEVVAPLPLPPAVVFGAAKQQESGVHPGYYWVAGGLALLLLLWFAAR